MVGGTALFLGLVNNLAIFVAMIVIYGMLIDRIGGVGKYRRQIILGLSFGLFAVGCMYAKIPVAEGVIVDQRNAVIALSGAFGGPLAALLSAAFAGAFRFYLGGLGATAGVIGVTLAAAAGIFLHIYLGNRQSALRMGIGAVVAAVIIMPGFLFVGDLANGFALMKAMTLPFGTAITLGIFLGGLLLAREERRRRAEVARMKTEQARLKALAELQNANKAKSEFLAAMSHELRTPLNAILGFSEMIRTADHMPRPQIEEYATDIHLSGQHLLALINDILDITTIEAGKRTITKVDLDFCEIARQCIRSVDAGAQSKFVDIQFQAPEHAVLAAADERALRQIVLNILSNAIKFSHEKGRIVVTADSDAETVTISVVDEGIGIPAADMPTIAHPFTRANTNPHIATEGTGLGLSIVSSLVALHNGSLNIESREGQGTVVKVTLPKEARAPDLFSVA